MRARRASAPTLSVNRMNLLVRILPVLVLTSAAGCLFGCGVQGSPHPPRLERPAKIADLTAVQVGQSVEVHFTLPQETTEGERLTKPQEVEILRAIVPPGSGLAKLPEPEVWISLLRDEWFPYSKDNVVSYAAHLTESEFHDWRGRTLVVAVRTLTRGFRHHPLDSDPSNFVDVPIYDVSPPVGGVRCVTTEKAVEVYFTPPTAAIDGEPIRNLAGYRLFRSATGQASTFELWGETTAPPFRDTKFEFGQTYHYQVRAIFGQAGHWAMSEASTVVKTTPRDTFPPAPPQGLSSIYSAGAVELVWSANSEPDLAGYNVYRLDNRVPRRLNKDLVRTPIFRDATAPPGATLVYYVTAVDLTGNESKPSKNEQVEAQ